ncbi:MAG: amidohydrolase family protein [Myxococcota bacterium]
MSTWLRGCWLVLVPSIGLAEDVEISPFSELEARGVAPIEPAAELDKAHVVLAGGTVMTAVGQVYEPGWIELKDGQIVSLGEGEAPQRPGAAVLDVSGQFVTPGLIDTHSHLGVYPSPGARAHRDGNEMTRPTTGGVWAEHSVWPQDPGFLRAVAGGVTSLQILPGSANLIGGRGVVLQAIPARGGRAMRFPGAPETLKMACGENPKRVYEKSGPSTRMGNLHGQRSAYIAATEYQRTWQKWSGETEKAESLLQKWTTKNQARLDAGKAPKGTKPKPADNPPKRDLEMETLVGVIEGRVMPQVHCYRADDMLSFLQLADEFGFEVRSFHHALEAYKIRDILAERQVSVSTWADWWGFKMEAYDGIPQNAAMVEQAGGRTIIHSDSAIGIQRLNQEAAKAWRSGTEAGIEITADRALAWITLNPAWALGIHDQTGSLEAGKRADVVVWTADPFSVYSKAKLVFVGGSLIYDVERPPPWSDFETGQGVTP